MGKPKKRPVKTPENNISMHSNQLLEGIWDDLKEGAAKIFRGESMSGVQYMTLYSCVYNYCTNVQQKILAIQKERKQNISGAHIVGLELYKHLRKFLHDYLENLRKVKILKAH